MLKVAVVGATGYTGEELVRILSRHPGVKLVSLSAVIDKPDKISNIFPRLEGKCDLVCGALDKAEVNKKADLVFLALPHRVSMQMAPVFLKAGKKVIDLSADYRLSVKDYEKWYDTKHTDLANLEQAVYGLPELYRDRIKKAKLIANPGCYPTSVILAAAPLIKEGLVDESSILVDSKTGASGAGRKAALSLIFPEVNESVKPYKVDAHQHAPEMEQELTKISGKKVQIVFVPHLLPIDRGILSNLYFKPKKAVSTAQLLTLYKKFYKDEPFVKVSEDAPPQIKDVAGTNFCKLWVKSSDKKAIIVISAIDNLLKGAAGQAVQNMNIMYGFDERAGLI